MSGSLQGKIALVTGAGGGIGEAIARALAAAGADVAIHDREMSPALAAGAVEIEQFGRRAVAVAGDVRDENGVAAFVAQAMDRHSGQQRRRHDRNSAVAYDARRLAPELSTSTSPDTSFACARSPSTWRPGGPARSSTWPRNSPTRRRRARSLQRRKGRRSRIDQSRGEGTGPLRYPRQCYRSRPDRDEDDRTLQNAGLD